MAVDGSLERTRWAAGDTTASLKLSPAEPFHFDRIAIHEYADFKELGDGFSRARSFCVQEFTIDALQGGEWKIQLVIGVESCHAAPRIVPVDKSTMPKDTKIPAKTVRSAMARSSGAWHPEGFALVATMALVALVLLLLVGLVSLSTTQTKTVRETVSRAKAQANARLALAAALGNLQRALGPDQRISSRSDILERPDFVIASERRYLTGVWDSSKWDPTKPEQKTFVDWLINRDAGAPAMNEAYVTTAPTGQTVTLVGKGTVAAVDQQIQAKPTVLSRGAYAYVVLDDGVKANLAVPDASDTTMAKLARTSVASRTAVKYSTLPEFKDSVPRTMARTLTQPTIDLLYPSVGNDLSKRAFHDFTTVNASLFTDVRRGGIRHDLSSAFELSLDTFNAIPGFHNAREVNNTGFYNTLSSNYQAVEYYAAARSPDLGYIFQIPVGGQGRFRGPSWDLLRNHYRLYKRDRESATRARDTGSWPDDVYASRGELPLSYCSSVLSETGVFALRANPGALYTKAGDGGYRRMLAIEQTFGKIADNTWFNPARAARLAPSVVRLTIAFGLVKRKVNGEETLAVSFDPYFTIHNPYNVPIEFDSFGFFVSKMNPVRITIRYTDESGASKVAGLTLSGNYFTQGSVSLRMPVAGSRYRLQAGEVKTVSPQRIDPATTEQVIKKWGTTPLHGSFAYSEGAGIVAVPDTTVKPRAGSSVKLEIQGRANGSEIDHFIFSLFSPRNHSGATRDIDTHLPPNVNIQVDTDVFDDEFVTKLSFCSHDDATGSLYATRTVGTSQIPNIGEDGLYVAALDASLGDATSEVPAFIGFDPRAQAVDTRDYDTSDRISPNWKLDLTPITDLSQLQLATDLDGHALWGNGKTFPAGVSEFVLYEVPRLPMTSLAQFQHADISVTASGGSRQIGNSFTAPGLADLSTIQGRRYQAGNFATVGPQILADSAWAANEMLWDRYFFSGMNYGTRPMASTVQPRYGSLELAVQALLDRGESPFFNPFVQLCPQVRAATEKEQKEYLSSYDKIANYLWLVGGLNINSTSVEAWKAILGGSGDLELPSISPSGKISFKKFSNEIPTGRFALLTGADDNPWTGTRSLTADEIDRLAKAIVKQVRIRGPFMGLADFVNRRLTNQVADGYETGALGALQMAIDDAGLNDSLSYGKAVSAANIEHRKVTVGGASKARSSAAGAAGHIVQADILSLIGGRLSPRSDTFTVRAYGDVRNDAGNITNRAWCEAVVQRLPEWISPQAEAAIKPNPDYPASQAGAQVLNPWVENDGLSQTNRYFGRRFRILSFRWLTPEEV